MKVRKGLVLLLTFVLVLAVSSMALAAPPQWVQEKKAQKRVVKQWKEKFRDMSKHWAEEAVERMNAKGLIDGYEDRTYRPKAPVTNEEALAMIVRAVYPNNQVDTENVLYDMKHWKQLSSPWAMGILAVAVDNELTSAGEMFSLIPKKPAKRIDVVRYIAKALMNGDIEAADLNLDFIDIDKVDETDMALLERVVAAGIFQGNPDGTFQPFKPISRAEMAILLQRIDDRIDNEVDGAQVKGALDSIEDSEITVTVDGDEETYDLAEEVSVFRNNHRAELDDLTAGDEVLVIFNEDGAVKFIAAREMKVEDEVKGVITQLDTDEEWVEIEDNDGDENRYDLADDIIVKIDDANAAYEDLIVGDNVELELENELVVKIKVEVEEDEVSGIVSDIDSDEITILVDDEEQTYTFTEDVEVEINDEDAAVSDIEEGVTVNLEVVRGSVIKIEVEYETEEKEGVVGAVYDDEIIVLVDDDEETYQYAENLIVEVDGEEANVDDITEGDSVELEVIEDTVYSISAESDEVEIEGQFVALDADEITVLVDGDLEEYELADDVEIVVDEDMEIGEVPMGSEVVLQIQLDKVVRVEIDAN